MSHETTGLTVIVPNILDSLKPIEIIDKAAGLRSVLVERYALDNLPEDWYMGGGFYVLLSELRGDNTFTSYVGQTDYSFRLRMMDHDTSKDFWRLAILFKRETDSNPFDRNETRYLEGLMRDALNASPNVRVTNIKPTGEKNMPEHNKEYMDNILLAALRVMFMRGYRNRHLGEITRGLEQQESELFSFAFNNPVVTAPSNPSENVNSLAAPLVKPATDEEATIALRKICREIHSLNPSTQPSYMYWSGKKLIAHIVEVKPKTVEELTKIPQVRKELLLGADQIIALFQ